MKKTNYFFLLFLFVTSQVFAQQSQSFAEHWFGIKQQNVKKSVKTAPKKAFAKAGLRSSTIHPGDMITLDLSDPTYPVSFDLDTNRVWTETYNDVDYPFIEFNDSAFSFSHLIGGEGSSYGGYAWDGFTYSKNGDNTDYGTDWLSNQWGNMAGGGIKTDAEGNILTDENGIVLADSEAPYLLGYWTSYMDGYYDYSILTVLLDDVYQAEGVYVNNSPWPYYGNLHNDGYARALDQDGDYFKLIIHGLDENYEDNGKEVEYYLAQNVGGGIENLHQSANWEWVDLSELGEIGGIYFTMESTDSDPLYGMNTAAYFCMDKLQVKKVDTTPTHLKNIKEENTFSVYSDPLVDYVIVNTTTSGIATIYNLSGHAMMSVNLKNGSNRMETSVLPKGVYVLKLNENTIKFVK
ncbi:MAG: DUF4465 domain-containing protein [Candidatus Azobacteroides sp.]|nr:DUF4465 domain-containing protein [Candidatus Azobacteroides sp.]